MKFFIYLISVLLEYKLMKNETDLTKLNKTINQYRYTEISYPPRVYYRFALKKSRSWFFFFVFKNLENLLFLFTLNSTLIQLAITQEQGTTDPIREIEETHSDSKLLK